MSTARRFALAAVFLMFAAVLCGSVAQAEPDPRGTPGGDPSVAPAAHQPDDGSAPAQGPGGSGMSRRSPLEQAQAEVRARQLVADRLQSELDAADRVSRSLATRAGLAAEAHNAAVARSAEARQAAADAAARFDDASRAQQAAESRIGSLAAERYRQGPDLTQLLAFTHVGSFRDLTDRQEALRRLYEAEAAAVHDARAAAQAALAARQQAQDAAAAQEAAEQLARATRDAAAAAAATEQAQTDRLRAQREAILAQLAQAQGVALNLERQRQQALAEQAAQQEAAREAAARQAAEQQAADQAAAEQRAADQRAVQQRAAQQRSAAEETSAHDATEPDESTAPHGARPASRPIPYAAGPAHALLAYVFAQLGKPYVWGGAGPDVFDCSGLAMRGLEAAGWSFPHPAQWQYLAMHPVSYADLQPGDLVFWAANPNNPHTIYHEAIAIGRDRIIQAPRPGGVVEEQSLWANGAPSFYARP